MNKLSKRQFFLDTTRWHCFVNAVNMYTIIVKIVCRQLLPIFLKKGSLYIEIGVLPTWSRTDRKEAGLVRLQWVATRRRLWLPCEISCMVHLYV